jgi:DNA polymerase III epsilon subunit family exonuclease
MELFYSEKLLQEMEFVALDLETTGLTPGKDEIVEIAGVRFNQNKVLGEFNELIKPLNPISAEASNINGILNSDLVNARSISEVFPEFLNFIQSSVLVIHNAKFDLSFLIHQGNIQKLNIPLLPVFCTLQMTRKLFPAFKKYNLVALRERFQIEKKWYRTDKGESFHEALDDCYATMQVMKRCLNLGKNWIKTFPEVVHHEKGLKYTNDYNDL